MNGRSRFGRFSVRVRLHPTWIVATILITGILVTQYPGYHPLWERVLFALLGSLTFFLSMVVVALLHSVAAVLAGVGMKNAVVFVFGDAAVVAEDATLPSREVVTAVVSLLLNFVMAGVFNWLSLSESRVSGSQTVVLLQWLAFFWYLLALLHIIPAFPLAGGRILSAAVWKSTGSYLKGIRFSSASGLTVGVVLALLGVFRVFATGGQTANGLLLIFVGSALAGAAGWSIQRVSLLNALQHTTARNVMTAEFPIVRPDASLSEVVHDRAVLSGQDYFAVADPNRLLGVVTIRDIARVPKSRWNSTQVRAAMIQASAVTTVSGGQSAAGVLEQMDRSRVDRVPVTQNGAVIGIATRETLLRLSRVRSRLRV